MLPRFVRVQLTLFTIMSVIGLAAMAFGYMQVPTWFGLGHITVTMKLSNTGGLYRFGNVTYRGVQIGKVSSVTPTTSGAVAELSLKSSPRIPADVQANVRSVSAVGEQYVDLIPKSGGPPFLHDGDVIPATSTSIPLKVGPLLDQLDDLVKSVPKEKVSALLDESFTAFDGAGYDIGSLIDSGSQIAGDANATSGQTKSLIEDSGPLLEAASESVDSLRVWTRSFAAVTDEIVDHDSDFRTILRTGPGTADEVSRLLDQIKPTLPVLLANMTTIGQIGVTYNPSLEQLLVLLPPYVGGYGSMAPTNNPAGLSLGAFSIMNGDPPPCMVGFLPPSQWRSPADESVIDTPDDLYCKLPQDAPVAVRGIRNAPCMGHPGKRAPTVEICNSDKPYEPLAMRQHALGPVPFDPNTVAQGIPLDSRADPNERTFAPPEGTPLPPEIAIPPMPPDGMQAPLSPEAPPLPETPRAPGPPPDLAVPSDPQAAPSGFSGADTPHGPSVATASYDPRTGRYVGDDGNLYQQTDLQRGQPPRFEDLLPH